MTDDLDYQSALWAELANYLQGTWKEYADAFAELRLNPTFIGNVGLAPFLPIHQGIATTVFPSTANRHGASGMNYYEDKKGS
jgi:hypothetical protein